MCAGTVTSFLPLSLDLDLDTVMGPVVNAKVVKAQLFLWYLLLLLPCLSTSTRTPHASRVRGGGAARSSEEDHVDGVNTHPRRDAPPMFYRTLSRRSVGRYVLATSSLVGECVRVYTPAPLSSIASSLCSRFMIGLDSRGRNARGPLGKRRTPGLSYDKFMSPDKRTGDEEDDLSGDGDPVNGPIPPDKYCRVSSAFLVRHEIGGDSARTSQEPAAKEATDAGVELPSPVLVGDVCPQPSTPGVDRRRRPSPQATAGSVFKSLGSLGRDKRRKPILDDMDLLSDSDDDADGDGWNGEAGGGVFSNDEPVVETPVEADAVRVAPKTTVGRNLVDVDDAAATLINKLRLGRSGARSNGRNRRKTK